MGGNVFIMARRIIVDGIKLEGEEAERMIDDVMRDVDEAGAPRRITPLSLLAVVAVACGHTDGGHLRFISLADGRVLAELERHPRAIVGLAWTPDGDPPVCLLPYPPSRGTGRQRSSAGATVPRSGGSAGRGRRGR